MTLKAIFRILFSLMAVQFVVILILVFFLNWNREELTKSQKVRYESYQRADELRQSSDDLTRFARTYTISGNPIYREYFQEVLDIRNGLKERPIDYHRIYWDLVGKDDIRPRKTEGKVSLHDMMKELGFSKEEFDKLKEAQKKSDALVKTEEIAMNAVLGKIDRTDFKQPRYGESLRDFAIRIMHDDDYHREKKEIMTPIDEFFVLIEKRTEDRVVQLEKNQVIILYIIIGIAFFFLVTLFASYTIIGNKISNPLFNFAMRDKLMQKVGQGDLSIRAPIHEEDEIGIIFKEFNKMVESQIELIAVIKEAIQGVSVSSREMSEQSSEFSAALSQITTNSELLINFSGKQTDLVQEAEATYRDISKKLSENREELKGIEDLSKSSKELSNIGIQTIENVSIEMDKIQESMERSSHFMNQMKDKSKSINEIIEVISGIAEQTNLLALNAAIEAARAGDSGRGFTIVASEVSKLADGSISASEKIKKLIMGLNKETEEMVTAFQSSAKMVEAGTTKVKEIGKNFISIQNSVTQLDGKLQNLNSSLTELNAWNEKMNEYMLQLLDYQAKSEKSFIEIFNAIEFQTQNSQKISAGSEELYAISDSLKSISDRFKLG